jgi:hypothetical protein
MGACVRYWRTFDSGDFIFKTDEKSVDIRVDRNDKS